jgi:DNA-directed RNA polymerase specialized sigma24 family protein
MTSQAGHNAEELAARAAAGDAGALEQLRQHHFAPLYDFTVRLVRDAHDAAHIAGNAIAAAVSRAGEPGLGSTFRAEAFRAARETCLARLGSERGFASGLVLETPDAEELPQSAGAAAAASLVLATVARLEPKHRSALDLHFRQPLELAEVAHVLGVSEAEAAQGRVRLAKAAEDIAGAAVFLLLANNECRALNFRFGRLTGRPLSDGTRRLVQAHANSCAECAAVRQRVPSAITLYAGLPAAAPGLSASAHPAATQAAAIPDAEPAQAALTNCLPLAQTRTAPTPGRPAPRASRPAAYATVAGVAAPAPGLGGPSWRSPKVVVSFAAMLTLVAGASSLYLAARGGGGENRAAAGQAGLSAPMLHDSQATAAKETAVTGAAATEPAPAEPIAPTASLAAQSQSDAQGPAPSVTVAAPSVQALAPPPTPEPSASPTIPALPSIPARTPSATETPVPSASAPAVAQVTVVVPAATPPTPAATPTTSTTPDTATPTSTAAACMPTTTPLPGGESLEVDPDGPNCPEPPFVISLADIPE